jgi:hypothetical protein
LIFDDISPRLSRNGDAIDFVAAANDAKLNHLQVSTTQLEDA